jgi:hypothetical protein
MDELISTWVHRDPRVSVFAQLYSAYEAASVEKATKSGERE